MPLYLYILRRIIFVIPLLLGITLVAFLIGTVIITLLYLVPVLGLLTLGVISFWGFGAATVALVSSAPKAMRRFVMRSPRPIRGSAPGRVAEVRRRRRTSSYRGWYR